MKTSREEWSAKGAKPTKRAEADSAPHRRCESRSTAHYRSAAPKRWTCHRWPGAPCTAHLGKRWQCCQYSDHRDRTQAPHGVIILPFPAQGWVPHVSNLCRGNGSVRLPAAMLHPATISNVGGCFERLRRPLICGSLLVHGALICAS